MPCGATLEIGWIPVRRTVERGDQVHHSDHLDVHVRLLPILEDKDQDAILRDELVDRGWTRQPDGSLTKPFGDAVATLAAGSSTIRVEVEASRAIKASATAAGRVREEDRAAQDAIATQAADEAARKLEVEREVARARLVRDNVDRLTRVHEQVEREVAEVVTATTKRALERRAAELGSVESVREGRDPEGGYELTITVRT